MVYRNFPTKAIKLLALFFLLSCSSAKSGKYVRVGHPYNLKEISKVYSVSVRDITNYNPGKSLSQGEWIFIPGRAGVINRYRMPAGETLNDLVLNWPLRGSDIRVSSDFGYRGFSHHDGLDLPAPRKTKIFAAASGKVIVASRMKGYGKAVVIDHGGNVQTLYAHNSELKVGVGQYVNKGDIIGLVGATGKATGNHLHFEVRIEGEAKDPLEYLPNNKNLIFQ